MRNIFRTGEELKGRTCPADIFAGEKLKGAKRKHREGAAEIVGGGNWGRWLRFL